MIDEVLQIGDEVVITIEESAREWGYNPYPDGTRATIVGFSTLNEGWANQFGLEPGVYENRAWAKLRINDIENTEWSGRFDLVDKEEYDRRVNVWRADRKNKTFRDYKVRVGDLPFTEFVEGDKVTGKFVHTMRDSYPEGTAYIQQVHYEYIGCFCNDGVTPMPLYSLSNRYPSGSSHGVRSSDLQDMKLVERGWVWKFRHNEPIDFPDLESQAKFIASLGYTEDVRNPVSGYYSWTKEEAVEAIYNGTAHGITVRGHYTNVFRFNDPVLGEQVRQLTMKGFPRA